MGRAKSVGMADTQTRIMADTLMRMVFSLASPFPFLMRMATVSVCVQNEPVVCVHNEPVTPH